MVTQMGGLGGGVVKKSTFAFLTVSFIVCFQNTSFAEVVSDARKIVADSPIHKFIYSKASYRKMYEIAVYLDRKLSIECSSRYDIKPLKLVILQPITMPTGASEPSWGAWKYQFEALRCGKTKIYNMFFGVRNGKFNNGPLFPGNSIASPVLLRDAAKAAIGGAVINSKTKCRDDFEIYDIKTVQMPDNTQTSSDRKQGSWVDEWTFLACGEKITSLMEYVPDGKGGTSFSSK